MSFRQTLATTCALFLTAQFAAAGVLPLNVTVAQEGANYRYSYDAVLTSDSVLRQGDYFTIFDFAGFVPGSQAAPVGFDFSSEYVGPTPPKVDAVDSPMLPNLTWTFVGHEQVVGQSFFASFSAVSTYSGTRTGDFSAQTHTQSDGTLESNITETSTPVPCHVPEPATWALFMLAAPAAWVVRRKLA